MLNACNAEALEALSFTKGIHEVMSVVGHTNEGGHLRKFLRRAYIGPGERLPARHKDSRVAEFR